MKNVKSPARLAGNVKVRSRGDVRKGDSFADRYGISLAIMGITFLVYFSSTGNGFVWDDEKYIIGNEFIKKFSLGNFLSIFSNFSSHNYAPISDLINSFVFLFDGLNPRSFHLWSLMVHLLNTFLVFRFLHMLSKRKIVAVIGAILFGIHPIQVESVAWASGSSTLYCTAFALASLIYYLKFIRAGNNKLLYLSLLFYTLSLLSKATSLMLPLALLLVDYLEGRKISKSLLLEKITFFILAIGFGWLTLYLRDQGGVMDNLGQFTFFQRIIFAFYAFMAYLLKILLPLNQSAFYPYPIVGGESIPILYYLPAFLFAGLVVLVFSSIRRTRMVLFGLGFFAVMILILIQLLPVGGVIMADRYTYLPAIGIFYLAGEGVYALWSRRKKTLAAGITAVFLLFIGIQSVRATKVWKDELTLWNHVIGQYENVPYAFYNRGNIYLAAGQFERALDDYNHAVENHLNTADVYYNRGNALLQMNRGAEALEDFSRVLEQVPDYYRAYLNRGNVYLNLQEYDKAEQDYTRAGELQPGYTEAFYNRGIVRYRQTRYAEALNDFSRAIELNPKYTDAYVYRAWSGFYEGKVEEACADIRKAAELGYSGAMDAIRQICK